MSAVLHIKNMVCPRCIETVQSIMESNGLQVESIKLGSVEIDQLPSDSQLDTLSSELKNRGFELLQDRKSQIVEQVKSEIILWIHQNQELSIPTENLSDQLARKLRMDYSALSHIFSASVGLTIEKYAILQKIEKVKELLSYDELTVSEIAFKLGYSSVAHLSSQFKKETGMTPGQFKKLKDQNRKTLDSIGS
ncbi:MAG TPA: AraC family transcriptional regulator [Draconibacterium sp.]|nr:AraC family transcriptional regulator [Draconibacterium sp.]